MKCIQATLSETAVTRKTCGRYAQQENAHGARDTEYNHETARFGPSKYPNDEAAKSNQKTNGFVREKARETQQQQQQ